MKIDKPMVPMDPAIAKVLVDIQRSHGQKVRDDLREYVDIERRLDWLNEHEPLAILPNMSDEEIHAAIDQDPNAVERHSLVSRKEALHAQLPTAALAMYRFPGVPTLILR